MNEPRGRVRWWRLLLAAMVALVALATLIGGAGTAAAVTGSHAGSRVGASTLTIVKSVGATDGITAGQGRGEELLQPDSVVAAGVAARAESTREDRRGGTLFIGATVALTGLRRG